MDIMNLIEKFDWLLIIIIFVVVFFLGRCSNSPGKELLTQTEIKRDTAYIVKESEPIVVNKYVPRLVYKKDTLIVTKPFTAAIDTIIKRDTIKASYDFPENSFSLLIKQKPDSMMVNTISLTKEVVKEKPWWETPVFILGGVIVGAFVGHSIK